MEYMAIFVLSVSVTILAALAMSYENKARILQFKIEKLEYELNRLIAQKGKRY